MTGGLLRLDTVIDEFSGILAPVYGKDAIKEAKKVIADYLDISTSLLRFDAAKINITPVQKHEIAERIGRRAKHEPHQYLSGTAYFMGEKFQVGRGVLIPRSDTEILVEVAADIAKKEPGDGLVFNFLEFCTGSGCISLSFIREMLSSGRDVRGTATDISAEALFFAARNTDMTGMSSKLKLIRHDIMSDLQLPGSCSAPFDMILANPPYVRTGIIPLLEPEVSEYEPHLALDGGIDGLRFFRRILECSEMFLAKGGWLVMEIGYDQEIQILDLIGETDAYENVAIKKDYGGNPRVVSGKKKNCRKE
ncbi:MAG: peptide chain release factor N(5)-glutamine methyltransferase [Saccharofermentanales bacterium]